MRKLGEEELPEEGAGLRARAGGQLGAELWEEEAKLGHSWSGRAR